MSIKYWKHILLRILYIEKFITWVPNLREYVANCLTIIVSGIESYKLQKREL